MFRSNYIFFEFWRTYEAKQELRDLYVQTFRSHFSEYLDEDLYDRLAFAGNHLLYACSSYVSIHPEYCITEIVTFVESFVECQLGEFLHDFDLPEWSDENYEAIHEKKEEEKKRICVDRKPLSEWKNLPKNESKHQKKSNEQRECPASNPPSHGIQTMYRKAPFVP